MKKKMRDDENNKWKQVTVVSTSAEIDALTRRLEEEDFVLSFLVAYYR